MHILLNSILGYRITLLDLNFVTTPVKAQWLQLETIILPTVYVHILYYNLQDLLPEGNFYTLTFFVTLGMGSEGKARRNGQWTVGFSFTTMLQHTGLFGQGFLSSEWCDNTGTSPILFWPGSIWFLPIPSTEINIQGTALLWCCWLH